MSRVLFACWPFEGHVFPQLSIALAMRDRGHEVAFYTGPELRDTVEAQDVPVFGFASVRAAWRDVRERERAVSSRRRSLRVEHGAFRRWLVETIPGQVADLRAIIDDWAPDVIVTDASMWGPSLIVGETAPIPVALASPLIGALIPGPDGPPPGSGLAPAYNARGRAVARAVTLATELAARGLRRRLDELRAGYGLAPMGCGVNAFMGRLPLYLVLSVPELDHNRWDLAQSVRYVGPCLWHPPAPATTGDWLSELPSRRPWVHVTDGTSHFQDPFVLRAAAQGLRDEAVEVIITHGRERLADEPALGPPAPNVHVARWVSHDALLPRCAALVTTGGAGSTMAGLRAAVPLVMVPTTWDKPDNARRVAEAGAGVILSPRRCTPDGLRAAVMRVLSEPSYRLAAERSAQRLAAAPGPEGAAQLIERLVPQRREAVATSAAP